METPITPNANQLFLFNDNSKFDKKFGYKNSSGEVIIPCVYKKAQEFLNGVAVVGNLENNLLRYGVIDETGKIIIPPIYEAINRIDRDSDGFTGFAITKLNKKFGLISRENKEHLSHIYEYLDDCNEEFLICKVDKLYGIISYNGTSIFPLYYDKIYFKNGKVKCEKGLNEYEFEVSEVKSGRMNNIFLDDYSDSLD